MPFAAQKDPDCTGPLPRNLQPQAGEAFCLRCPSCQEVMPYSICQETCRACGCEWLDLEYPEATRNDLVVDHDPLGRTSMWRYRRLLPVREERNIVSMGEGLTPLLPAPRLGGQIGIEGLLIKDERASATGSFKDRAASIAVSNWVESGVTDVSISSTGNVGASFAAYCARAGIRLWIFLPHKVNATKFAEVVLYGHRVIRVEGNYDQAGAMAKRFAAHAGILADLGIRSPLRRESMKAMAFEIAEDLNWEVPDWYVQAVSGGIGPLAVWKGFQQLHALGLISKLPKIAVIQTAGCAPMLRSFERDTPEISPVEPHTDIETLTTGRPAGYPLVYRVLKDSHGAVEAVEDEEAFEAQERLARTEGVFAEAASAVAFAGAAKLARKGVIRPGEKVVCVCSGKGLRDMDFVFRRLRNGVAASLPADTSDFRELEALLPR